jgi:protease I
MARDLAGMRIAILATDGVERVELEQPRGALYGAGASTDLLSIHPGEIQARQFDLVSAGTFSVDREVSDASADEYDALLLPGGTVNPVDRPASRRRRDRRPGGRRRRAVRHQPFSRGSACLLLGDRRAVQRRQGVG